MLLAMIRFMFGRGASAPVRPAVDRASDDGERTPMRMLCNPAHARPGASDMDRRTASSHSCYRGRTQGRSPSETGRSTQVQKTWPLAGAARAIAAVPRHHRERNGRDPGHRQAATRPPRRRSASVPPPRTASLVDRHHPDRWRPQPSRGTTTRSDRRTRFLAMLPRPLQPKSHASPRAPKRVADGQSRPRWIARE